MNQKALKYSLLAGVAIVWSLIIYRVVSGLGRDDKVIPGKMFTPHPLDYISTKDTFSLFADYPDPFLPEEDTVLRAPKNDTVIIAATLNIHPPPPPPVDISFIQYHGMISNPAEKMKMALLSIHGKEMMFREKQAEEHIKVIKILPRTLILMYEGKTYNIVKGD